MTIEQLRRSFPGANEKTWHRHVNGGGWVENTTHVDDTVFVGPDALVYDWAQVRGSAEIRESARVYDNARVYGEAQLHGTSQVYGYARVYDSAQIYDSAQVYGQSRVYGSSRVYESAQVYNSARISGASLIFGSAVVRGWGAEISGSAQLHSGTWDVSPLYIQGTRHRLCQSAPDWVMIGCEDRPIDWWLAHYRDVGKIQGYTPDQIKEYGAYLRLAKRYHVKKKGA